MSKIAGTRFSNIQAEPQNIAGTKSVALTVEASAVDLLEMSAGDTIGHGLALGTDIERFNARNSPVRLTTRGGQFDALLWLLFELEQHDSSASSGEIVELRNWLLDEVQKIYGQYAAGLHTLQDLRKLPAERVKPLCVAFPSRSHMAARMRHAELKAGQCATYRAQRVPIHHLVYGLGAALKRVQARQLNRLADLGIVLEFNPSSNFRVSGSGRLAEAPFVAILNSLREKCLATVNSDNPGVFGTRIENEFALVSRALKEVGLSRTESMAVVERLRRVGREAVYWPRKSLHTVGGASQAGATTSAEERT